MIPKQPGNAHSVITIPGHDGYNLHARFRVADNPVALVVIVHGVVSHSEWLESIALPLSKRQISSLAVDRRGAGMNQPARGDAPSEHALLEDLHAVLQWAMNKNLPVHACGFCWGSNYLVNYLAKQSADIRSMLFIAPSLFPSAWILQRPFVTGDAATPTEEPVMPIDQFTDGPLFDAYIKPDPLRLRKVSQRMNRCMQAFSTGLWMKFLRLELPCLFLLGENDTVVDNAATAQVFNRYKAEPKQLHTLPAAHGIQFDAPELAVEHITQWIHSFHEHTASTTADKTITDHDTI